VSVLTGRLAEAVGRSHDALAAYRFAAASATGRRRRRASFADRAPLFWARPRRPITSANWKNLTRLARDETEVEALQLARLHRAGQLPRTFISCMWR
jgi:hypothetical protein